MKRTIALLIAIFWGITVSYAQFGIEGNPVKWSIKTQKTDTNIYEISLTAHIQSGWHTYDLGPYENGPNATTLVVDGGAGLKVLGEPYLKQKEKKEYDSVFNMDIGIIEDGDAIAVKAEVLSSSEVKALVTVEWQACKDGTCLPPEEKEFNIKLPAGEGITDSAAASPDSGTSDASSFTPVNSDKSLWSLILEAIAWGLMALLTPCVFPMVPMTVSFFLKQNEKAPARGKLMAMLYGLSIVLVYTLPIAIIILITYIAGGGKVTADIFNWLATNWLPNILFFLIFMIFAMSFFGAFEITMPSWLTNKASNKSGNKGIGGIFFMALTLVLVSFSCTGPIVGTIVIKSTQGEVWSPIIAMLAFSITFAIPFTVCAFMPSLLNNLPKSGGWLNTVKVVLGFVELALGMKFLSVADQVYHWGILDREVYLAFWIVIFSLLGFYLLGKLRFKYDSPSDHVGIGRLILSIIVFAFVVYMIPGMWGAPLKALSGYLPPVQTQDFKVVNSGDASAAILGDAVNGNSSSAAGSGINGTRKYSDFLHLPHGLNGYFTYQEALAASKATGKPILLDFTGQGCVSCREMEARVWSAPEVLKLLREDFIICSLTADDKTVVPESDWVTLPNGKVLKRLGTINSRFMMDKFKANAQPFYIILNSNGDPIVEPMGYNLDVKNYVNFLQKGLTN